MYSDNVRGTYQRSQRRQRHVHEISGSTQTADINPHSHRFAAVTCEAIPSTNNNHIHEVWFRTDLFREHYHEFRGKTTGAVKVGDRHVHFIHSVTSVNDRHRHEFRASTFIEDPTAEK